MGKSLYELGEMPPLGSIPEKMYASVIRQDRFGEPQKAFATEVIDTPQPGRGQVLVWVMAAGINYNNVWAGLGYPLDVIGARQKRGEPEDFHIGGSEGSGVVFAVGEGVSGVRAGDQVVLSGGQWDETSQDIRLGGDPTLSPTLQAWGYESNYGSFAQFALVQDFQCHPKPKNLTWEAAAAFILTGATAYRQLFGWAPNTVQPGDPVLIWGGAGGLGSMAIQLVRNAGGLPIAVVSSEERAEYCRKLGAVGTINRHDFAHWGRMPDLDDQAAFGAWMAGVRSFGRAYWEALGDRRAPKVVLEHSGQDTIPTSMYLCDTGGMVTICGGTSGYAADVDLRFLWMRQKRLQGSHGFNPAQCRAVIHLVGSGQLDPCLSELFTFGEIGEAHQQMHENRQPPGNMAALVNARRAGLTDLA
ncbi:crotonyl-CoA carboxylase/reductase [Streptomyces sp. SID13666]|uniref:crotonyl-CoA carboxylase/reductase n=1 Tax=unclassified Streptomyces TaxID=2593676 RepID=UPI0013BF864A|nr:MULTISPECIES: crotonyl-CoA carboxylase/reductase [unclassified Streptomyces]NEA55086.1 crotonyl-CoA carboxylase/reductase [Streptomyces sp. SID13666]NEA71093.1 crotonyl-CoA carboxylase/reductase [Streptomyces sp. SID13588]